MASKTPLQKLQDTIVGTVKGAVTHPVDTAGKAVEQAKGTISVGRVVAGQVVKGAADVVTSRLPGRHGGGATTTHAPDRTPEVSRPAPASTATTERAPAKKAPAKKAPAKKAPPKKAPANKPAAKKAPAKPTPVKPPVTDLATELVKEQAAHQPVPEPTPAPESPIDAAADTTHVDATPADVAKKATPRKPAAKKAPASRSEAPKAPATKSTPSAKLPPKRSTPPKTAAELIEDPDLPSPIESIGTSAASDPEKG